MISKRRLYIHIRPIASKTLIQTRNL